MNGEFIDMYVWSFTPSSPPLPFPPRPLLFYILIFDFNVTVKCCEAAHALVVRGALEFSIYDDDDDDYTLLTFKVVSVSDVS